MVPPEGPRPPRVRARLRPRRRADGRAPTRRHPDAGGRGARPACTPARGPATGRARSPAQARVRARAWRWHGARALMADRLLTPADVAERCQVSTKTVLRAI